MQTTSRVISGPNKMKIYKNIEQGSEEWLEIKWSKIGGSTLDDVMSNFDKSVKDNAIFNRILGEIMEDYDPFDESSYKSNAMEVGSELEPEAADEFSRITGLELYQVGWVESDNGFLGISPDRLIKGDTIKEALEIKCPTKSVYALYLIDSSLILTKYCWQIVDYFTVFDDIETLYFFVYRPQNKLKSHILLTINRDTVIQVNKKRSAKISDLVIDVKNRVNELKIELDICIEKIKEPMF